MENVLNSNLPPKYSEILTEAGAQLSSRKSILFKRTLFKVWPLVLLVLFGSFLREGKDFRGMGDEKILSFLIPYITLIVFYLIYSFIVGGILEIEKLIWVDSYFDRKNLNSSQSWKIARRLFFKFIVLDIRLFFKYSFLPLIIYLILTTGSVWGVVELSFRLQKGNGSILIWMPILIILWTILLIIYFYLLRVRLRYTKFLFLDLVGGATFSFKNYFDELDKLNEMSKSATFKQALILNFGTDSINIIAQAATGLISAGISRMGKAGQIAGGILNVVLRESSSQATSFANIASIYIIYKFAREQLYGGEQVINEAVYKLAE